VVDAFDYVSKKGGLVKKYLKVDHEVEGGKAHIEIAGRCRE
jgi:hypothetical protein